MQQDKPKKKLILHIGQSKTGTSSIKKFCQANRKKLAAEGIIYPSVKRSGLDVNLLEHNAFAESLCEMMRYPYLSAEEYWAQFEQQMTESHASTLFLSGESFFGAPQIWVNKTIERFHEEHRKKLVKLKSLIGSAYEIHIIVYLRHPLNWFRSALSHMIRHEGLGPKLYQSDESLYGILKPHMNYPTILELWEKTLSPSKITVRAFDKDTLIGKNAVSDIAQLIGFESAVTEPIKTEGENISWPSEITMYKKKINETTRNKAQERIIIEILDKIAKSFPGDSGPYQISESLQRQIVDDTKKDIELIEQKFGITFCNIKISPPHPVNQQAYAYVELTFKKEFSSSKIKMKIWYQRLKAYLRQNASPLYNAVKFCLRRFEII